MKIKNWDKFQHFKHKSDMKWFKCYGRDLLNDPDFMKMDDVKQATLFKLWCLASESNGILPNAYDIAFRLRKPIAFIEKMLIELDTWMININDIHPLYSDYITDKIRLEEDNNNTLDGFDDFWNSYPKTRRVGKKPCQDKWVKKGLAKIKDQIINHVRTMSDSKQWKDGYSPNPLTYINQERYSDSVEVNDPFAGAL